VALYESELQPTEVLAHTQSIERQLGRTEQSVILPDGSKSYADRLIDIDLIEAYDNNGIEVRMHTPALTLPHPRMQERQFVMEPLGIIKSHVINHT
jgi:2-amino-4-hydroxy-6-hydroxymethyldihydropteridine diphosphokinase